MMKGFFKFGRKQKLDSLSLESDAADNSEAIQKATSALVKSWLEDLTIEINAAESKKLSSYAQALHPGMRISLVHLPGKPVRNNIPFIQMLVDRGLKPVPHLAARNLSDHAELKEILAELQRLDVNEVLLVGGGLEVAKSSFVTVMDMLETGMFQDHGITKVAIAGHPEKHPSASYDDIMDGYKRKHEYFLEHGLDYYMITQFSFDPESILQLVEALSNEGLKFPVRVGIAGKTSLQTLLRYSIICGIGNSIKVLKKDMSNITNLTRGYRPETYFIPLAQSIVKEQFKGSDKYDSIEGIHIFPFGNLLETIEHLRQFR